MKVTLTPIQKQAQKLKSDMAWDALLGNYRGFKKASKEYASIAVKNIDSVRDLPSPKITVPLFSLQGLRMAYVFVRNFFRIKSPDEKLLKQMAKKDALIQKLSKH